MTNFLAATKRSRNGAGKILPLLLFLMGLGFIVIGARSYPAFIAVGGLFVVISYRGYTCCRKNVPDHKQSS